MYRAYLQSATGLIVILYLYLVLLVLLLLQIPSFYGITFLLLLLFFLSANIKDGAATEKPEETLDRNE